MIRYILKICLKSLYKPRCSTGLSSEDMPWCSSCTCEIDTPSCSIGLKSEDTSRCSSGTCEVVTSRCSTGLSSEDMSRCSSGTCEVDTFRCRHLNRSNTGFIVVQTRPGAAQAPILCCRLLEGQHRPLPTV